MVDFIRMGLLELCRCRVERELQNVKFLPTVGFEPGTPRLLSQRATTEATKTDVNRVDKSSPGFYMCYF